MRPREGEGSREGETVVVSSGSRLRPHKRLRAAPRCSVPSISGSIVCLPRSEEYLFGAMSTPSAQRAERPAAPAALPDTDRPHRRLDALVAFGGVTILGALIGFVLGERLVSAVANEPSVRLAEGSPSPAAERGPADAPGGTLAERGSTQDGSGNALNEEPLGGKTPDPATSYAVPVFGLSATASPFEPPWRDAAAMRQGNAPVTVEAFVAMTRDNRRLDAKVVALEAETMSLETELLDRELTMFAAGLPLDDADAAGSVPLPDEAIAPEPAPLSDDAYAADEAIVVAPDGEAFAPEEDVASLDEQTDAPRELELFASEMTSEPIEPSAASGRAIASAAMGAPQQRLVIAEVPPGGTAESVGLQTGDILLAVNDEEVFGMDSLIDDYDGDVDGGFYELTIVRDGASFPMDYAGNPAALSLRLDWVDPVFTER